MLARTLHVWWSLMEKARTLHDWWSWIEKNTNYVCFVKFDGKNMNFACFVKLQYIFFWFSSIFHDFSRFFLKKFLENQLKVHLKSCNNFSYKKFFLRKFNLFLWIWPFESSWRPFSYFFFRIWKYLRNIFEISRSMWFYILHVWQFKKQEI